MRIWFAGIGFLLLLNLTAQWDVPVRVVLDGATPGARQVQGLGDPTTSDAAVSAEALRSGSMSYAIASGSATLSANLTPAPEGYTTGMAVTIVPAAANEAGADLDLNGLGARPIVKWGQLPLDSADLPAGMPARLVFDGERFLLLNNATRPCPPSFGALTSSYCVSDSSYGPGTFYDGINGCESRNARLCSFGEWANACRNKPGFLGTITAYEWVDDAANNPNDAKTVGGGYDGPNIVQGFACEYGISREPLSVFRYRCCTSR